MKFILSFCLIWICCISNSYALQCIGPADVSHDVDWWLLFTSSAGSMHYVDSTFHGTTAPLEVSYSLSSKLSPLHRTFLPLCEPNSSSGVISYANELHPFYTDIDWKSSNFPTQLGLLAFTEDMVGFWLTHSNLHFPPIVNGVPSHPDQWESLGTDSAYYMCVSSYDRSQSARILDILAVANPQITFQYQSHIGGTLISSFLKKSIGNSLEVQLEKSLTYSMACSKSPFKQEMQNCVHTEQFQSESTMPLFVLSKNKRLTSTLCFRTPGLHQIELSRSLYPPNKLDAYRPHLAAIVDSSHSEFSCVGDLLSSLPGLGATAICVFHTGLHRLLIARNRIIVTKCLTLSTMQEGPSKGVSSGSVNRRRAKFELEEAGSKNPFERLSKFTFEKPKVAVKSAQSTESIQMINMTMYQAGSGDMFSLKYATGDQTQVVLVDVSPHYSQPKDFAYLQKALELLDDRTGEDRGANTNEGQQYIPPIDYMVITNSDPRHIGAFTTDPAALADDKDWFSDDEKFADDILSRVLGGLRKVFFNSPVDVAMGIISHLATKDLVENHGAFDKEVMIEVMHSMRARSFGVSCSFWDKSEEEEHVPNPAGTGRKLLSNDDTWDNVNSHFKDIDKRAGKQTVEQLTELLKKAEVQPIVTPGDGLCLFHAAKMSEEAEGRELPIPRDMSVRELAIESLKWLTEHSEIYQHDQDAVEALSRCKEHITYCYTTAMGDHMPWGLAGVLKRNVYAFIPGSTPPKFEPIKLGDLPLNLPLPRALITEADNHLPVRILYSGADHWLGIKVIQEEQPPIPKAEDIRQKEEEQNIKPSDYTCSLAHDTKLVLGVANAADSLTLSDTGAHSFVRKETAEGKVRNAVSAFDLGTGNLKPIGPKLPDMVCNTVFGGKANNVQSLYHDIYSSFRQYTGTSNHNSEFDAFLHWLQRIQQEENLSWTTEAAAKQLFPNLVHKYSSIFLATPAVPLYMTKLINVDSLSGLFLSDAFEEDILSALKIDPNSDVVRTFLYITVPRHGNSFRTNIFDHVKAKYYFISSGESKEQVNGHDQTHFSTIKRIVDSNRKRTEADGCFEGPIDDFYIILSNQFLYDEEKFEDDNIINDLLFHPAYFGEKDQILDAERNDERFYYSPRCARYGLLYANQKLEHVNPVTLSLDMNDLEDIDDKLFVAEDSVGLDCNIPLKLSIEARSITAVNKYECEYYGEYGVKRIGEEFEAAKTQWEEKQKPSKPQQEKKHQLESEVVVAPNGKQNLPQNEVDMENKKHPQSQEEDPEQVQVRMVTSQILSDFRVLRSRGDFSRNMGRKFMLPLILKWHEDKNHNNLRVAKEVTQFLNELKNANNL